MKVLIITPCVLPIPAVKGGAVLNLVETLIKENECVGELNLTVVGSYDQKAVEASKKYERTEFIFLKEPMIIKISDLVIDGLMRVVTGRVKPHKYLWKYYLLQKQRKILLSDIYDKVVFENSGYLLNSIKDKKIQKKYNGNLFYHLHNDIPNNIYIEGLRKCKIMSISRYLERKIIKLAGDEMSNRFYILHNGFDYAHFAQDFSNEEKVFLKRKLGIEENKKVVVFVGRIDPVKGIEQLVDAFEMLKRDDIVLLIMGSYNFASGQISPFEKKMRSKFESAGNRVIFTGYINHDEIWRYYKVADLAVLPSMWEEPAGLTIVEAMAAGLPVISTISGGIPEFLKSEYGILLARDEDIVMNISKAIEEIVDNYSEWAVKGKEASIYIKGIVDKRLYYHNFVEILNQK